MPLDDRKKDYILKLVKKCEKKDNSYTQFGSEKHKYKLNPPISSKKVEDIEKQYNFKLPKDYFWFITKVGNGGCGPNYGLYSFGNNYQSYDFKYLNKPHVLEPKSSKEEYEKFIEYYEDDNISDEEYERRDNELWQGLLTIGTAGCTYDMMLVVTGEHKGKILHIDRDRQRPYFSPDNSFIDWYERWLIETSLGYEMIWFNSRIGGNEYELIESYNKADEKGKDDICCAMFKFHTVPLDIINSIYNIYINEKDNYRKGNFLELLSKFKYSNIDKLIYNALKDKNICLNAIKTLHIKFELFDSVKKHTKEWSLEIDNWYYNILEALPLIISASPHDKTVYIGDAVRILLASKHYNIKDLEPFFNLENKLYKDMIKYLCKQKNNMS